MTKGLCVAAAPAFEIRDVAEDALMALVGMSDADRQSCWVVNAKGLVETLRCAGFSKVGIVSSFDLHYRRRDLAVHHLVPQARP